MKIARLALYGIVAGWAIQANINDGDLNGFHCSVDYLGWKAQEDQLQYALFVPQGVPAMIQDGSILNFNVVNQCFSFDSGVRLTAGYSWCDSWDVWVNWTHFRQNSCGGISSDVTNSLIAILFADPGITGNIFNFASNIASRWKLNLDTITADIGKHYDICDAMGIDLYCGIAGARIHQRQNVAYTDFVTGIFPVQPASTRRCNDFSGVGPHAGINMQWLFCSNVALVSSLSGALLVGEFCVRSFNTLIDSERTIAFPLHKHRVRPWVDFAVGLEWQPQWCQCADIALHLDFEAQYFPEQWQSVSNTLTSVLALLPTGGHLTTYGATLGLEMLF